MITSAMAKEQIQDRIRDAERDRRAAAFRRPRTRKGMSGLFAAVAGLRAARRAEDGTRAYRVRTA